MVNEEKYLLVAESIAPEIFKKVLEAKKYIAYLEKAVGCKIKYVSVGAARDEYIVL